MVCLLRYSNQLNVEDERGSTRNAGLGEFAVAHLCRNIEFPLVTDVHLLKGDNPAINQVAESHGNRCAANARVEFLAVDGPASVVNGDYASLLRLRTIRVARLQYLIIDAIGEGIHALLFSLVFQPLAVGNDVFALRHIDCYLGLSPYIK